MEDKKKKDIEDSIDAAMALCMLVHNSAVKMGFSETQAMLLTTAQLQSLFHDSWIEEMGKMKND